jgi:hypothetical protein
MTAVRWSSWLLVALLAAVLWTGDPVPAPAGTRPPGPICPTGSDGCVDRLVGQMRRQDHRLGCDHDSAFALLYWRTTEGIRDAIRAGEFSDRPFWNRITTAFGRYYLDAFAAWARGRTSDAPLAWRIAFRAADRERVSTLGDLYLGINAHVNHDLAFVYERLDARNHADHLYVNTVLGQVSSVVFGEIEATLDPTLAAQHSGDPTFGLDIFAWRERAWRNARRLRQARSPAARRRVAARIARHSVVMARRIRAAFPATRAEARARDAFCRMGGAGT